MDGLGHFLTPFAIHGEITDWGLGYKDLIIIFYDQFTLEADKVEVNVRLWLIKDEFDSLETKTCFETCLHCISPEEDECIDCIADTIYVNGECLHSCPLGTALD